MVIHVLFVCTGNICRSPMAEAVLTHLINERELADMIEVDSVGTSSWHVGEPAHRGTQQVLKSYGIGCMSSARQVTYADLQSADYIIAMDDQNVSDLQRFDRNAVLDGKVRRLLEFAPDAHTLDVPDPYYVGNFDRVYDLVRAGCEGLLEHIRAEHGL